MHIIKRKQSEAVIEFIDELIQYKLNRLKLLKQCIEDISETCNKELNNHSYKSHLEAADLCREADYLNASIRYLLIKRYKHVRSMDGKESNNDCINCFHSANEPLTWDNNFCIKCKLGHDPGKYRCCDEFELSR